MRSLAALLAVALLCAGDPPTVMQLPPGTPPSPSSVPGIRIWPPPAFTHWPAVVYTDEHRNAALAIPVKQAGAKGELGWEGDKPIPITLPTDAERTSALVDLAMTPGERRLRVALPDGDTRLPIRVVGAAEAWPLARLVDGYPVDAAGVPVVLLDVRRSPADHEKWALLRQDLPRPAGRPLLVGDPLEAMGDTVWKGLEAEARVATDLIKPHHAVLVALANLPDPLPRTVVWCPGNGGIRTGAADPEEVRLLGVLRSRFSALKAGPLLVIALPPEPVEERLREVAAARREALVQEADRCGWRFVDLARAAGDPLEANKVGDAVFTTYPTGPALVREREMLAALLAK